MDFEGYSEDFKEFYHWCISDIRNAAVARARGDVPIELVTKLIGDEL